MKYEITGNWKNGYKNDAVLFFAQSIEKLLNPNTDHINRLPVLNSYSLLYEYMKTFDLVENELIDKKHLEFISEELFDALEHDLIIDRILSKEQLSSINKKFNSIKNEEKRTVILYLINQLYKFNETAKDYILEMLRNTKNKNEIFLGLRSYLSYLIGGGYSEDFIFNFCKIKFNNNKNVSMNTVEDFLSRFDFVNQKFTVILPVNIEIKQFQKILEKRLPLSFSINKKSLGRFIYDSDKYVLISLPIEALDLNQASILAMNRLALFTRYYKFFSQSTIPFFGKSCIVIDEDSGERSFVKIRKNGLVNLLQEKEVPKLQLGEIAEGVITSLLSAEDNVFSIIDKAIINFNNARENKDLNSSFLNFWSVLESLCEQKDVAKISQIEQNILPILSKDYITMIFEDLIKDITDNVAKENLVTFYNKNFGKSLINDLDFMCLILLDEYNNARTELYSLLSEFPFIRYKIFNINKRYENHGSIQKDIVRFENRLKWHLRRLYRARNTIIHSGETPEHLQYLTKHLMEYTSQLLGEIIFNLTIREDISNVESLFIDIELFNSNLKAYLLKEPKNHILKEDIVYLISYKESLNAN